MMKKRIGIATFYAEKNYGAVLQAYALQEAIRDCDCDAEFLQYHETINHGKLEHKSKFMSRLSFLWHIKGKISLYQRLRKSALLRNNLFKHFQYDYLHVSPYPLYEMDDVVRIQNEYDAFVSGSDMVWTPMGQNLDFYFLTFAEQNKRLSYAPSLTGTSSFSVETHEKMKKYLSGIKSLCFREKEGVEYAKQILSKDSEQVLDPTFLMSQAEWADKLNLRETGEHYVLCYLFGEVTSKTRHNILQFSRSHKLPVRYVSLSYQDVFYEQNHGHTGAYGPKEFVELFYNAAFVITNTFHGFAFSVIMQKPFVVLHRDNNNRWAKNEGRISNMLNDFNWAYRYINPECTIEKDYMNISYEDIAEVFAEKQAQSKDYLRSMLDKVSSRPMGNSGYRNISELPEKNCTGCLVCIDRCPKKCIRKTENSEGFAVPSVDASLCVNCSACVKVCPAISANEVQITDKAYSVFAQKGNIDDSASGGMFVTLARYFIKDLHGIVVGCIFDEKMKCKHVIARTEEDLHPMQNSKYVQSDLSGVYQEVCSLLKVGHKVLFTGVPCQISAIKKIAKNHENLYTIDLLCHGVPSPKLWKNYLLSYDMPVMGYMFRNRNQKKNGLSSHQLRIQFEGKGISKHFSDDFYYSSFLRGENYRESCYYCRYANLLREGDLTIGDCDSWDYAKHDYSGELRSYISVNNEKGKTLFESVKDSIHCESVKVEDEMFVNETLNHPTVRPSARSHYYDDMNRMQWNDFKAKYFHKNKVTRLKSTIASLLFLKK